MLISCVLQCTDGLRLIKRLENYAYRMSEKTAYRSLEKSAYRSLKKLLTVHLQIHLTACILRIPLVANCCSSMTTAMTEEKPPME